MTEKKRKMENGLLLDGTSSVPFLLSRGRLVIELKNCCLKRCENCGLKVLLKYVSLVFIK